MFYKWQGAVDNQQKTITDADFTDDLAHLANTPAQADSLQISEKQAAKDNGLNMNPEKQFVCFNQD